MTALFSASAVSCAAASSEVEPGRVLESLAKSQLVDGFPLVLDLARSHGSWLVDERDGANYLDMFGFFASNALGMNHPALAEDEDFVAELGRAALSKPSNSDVYTTPMARFVEAFRRILGVPELPRLFFIDGGALAVENALKVAFDWKSQRNEAEGRLGPDGKPLGTKVLHLTGAFHGRSGYTMSLTNTDPAKTDRFPKFDWPRIEAPHTGLADVEAAEERALDQIRAAFAAHLHDIACFIAEPIQGEGGDRHLRPEFLLAVQGLCREHDALFVLDEVQTGVGMTGTMWAHLGLGLEPDIVAFGKKTQVCGIMAGRRVEDLATNAMRVSSRINSTWGGNLADMVRARRIYEVIEAENLVDRAARLGEILLEGLEDLAERRPNLVAHPRGRGLMCAIDLPSAEIRNAVVADLFEREQVIILGTGERGIRFRPTLTVTEEELALALGALDRALGRVSV
ncbi:L-lysine 6-transaminase [Segniliparus rugosus]|uniref:L-lysine-epsilon aminotransferase n=1 Tax=Segniliparus rugosus (strain ATCC BAA-974 / DSM 45345 / CCUG 50838 / CIP 108380 / JCM 13579 / CDC 945) TaxID=679197 RepID=E5XSJ7_SEGRC|nr:L-lysine 6-transaminase [Segniliparus rugosus]EFV12674.1 L-lysine 6-transaminase [Segniliparus rugosus ATCC BAA-974]